MTANNPLSEMQAMASLFKKKAAVVQALEGGIVKSGENTHFNYKFMTASAIKAIVGQLFAVNGIVLQMSGIATENAVSIIEIKGGGTKQVPILRIQFQITLCDIETGAVEQSFWFGEAGATDDKAASKCATSALKYYLISNLMIADKEEDKRDTDRSKRPAQRQTEAPAPIPPKPAQTPNSDVPEWYRPLIKSLRGKMDDETFKAFAADVKRLKDDKVLRLAEGEKFSRIKIIANLPAYFDEAAVKAARDQDIPF